MQLPQGQPCWGLPLGWQPGYAALWTYNLAMGGAHPLSEPDESSFRTDRQDPYLRLYAVNVFVRDQERSLRFYLDQLGFQVAFDTRLQSGDRWVAVTPPDGTAILVLVAPKRNSEEHKLIGRSTDVVFVTEDVAAKFKEWSRRGVRFLSTPRLKRLKFDQPKGSARSTSPSLLLGEQKPIWGGVFARFRDIDGNSFSLVSFDEVTHAVEMQRRALAEKREAERRAEQELEIAKQVQARLFPQNLPKLRTLDYAGVCIQARQVGGDYYDFLNLGRDRVGLVIGDISGKGMPAALLMANLQANLRSQCAIALDQPERFLQSVNQLFCENTPDGAYATLFFAEYEDSTGRLRYVNCGHWSALVLRGDNSVEHLESTSTVLGLFRKWDCAVGERQIFPGDSLALYTDGITESRNADDEEFGEQRLIDALQRSRNGSCQSALETVVEEVRRFGAHEQQDDITLILARRRID